MIASLILLTTLAQATAPAANPEAKAKAKILLSEGTRLYDQGELAPALEKFTQAYAEYASPKLLFNIAQTKRALGRLAEAMAGFERFLFEAPDDSIEMTADAHAAMAELQAKLGRLRIECSIARAEISVDGKVVGLSPLPNLLWAEPGMHQITARHVDAMPYVQDTVVTVGAIRNVAVQLQSLDPSTDAVAPASPKYKARKTARTTVARQDGSTLSTTEKPQSQDSDPSQGWWLGRKWTWVTAGTGVALAAAATVVSISVRSKFDSLNQSCGSASASYPGCSEGDISTVNSEKNTANLLWALTGAAAVATGILFVVEGQHVEVAPVAGGAFGLTARLTY